MFTSPKGSALLIGLIGLAFGVLFTTVTDRQNVILTIPLSLLVGALWGVRTVICWRRNESKGKGFGLGWLFIVYLALLLGNSLGFKPEVEYVAGGYGLAFWIAIRRWEQRRKKPILWSDLNPKQEE
jgi:hypothetical protein